jgi:hypothetical protein
VELLDTLSAKDCFVVGAVEMLYSLLMTIANQTFDAFVVFEIDSPQDMVSLDYFVENVEI